MLEGKLIDRLQISNFINVINDDYWYFCMFCLNRPFYTKVHTTSPFIIVFPTLIFCNKTEFLCVNNSCLYVPYTCRSQCQSWRTTAQKSKEEEQQQCQVRRDTNFQISFNFSVLFMGLFCNILIKLSCSEYDGRDFSLCHPLQMALGPT